MSSTDALVANSEQYAANFDKGDLPLPPALHTAVVACMDARLNPYGVLGLTEGDAHVIRNAGGVVTDDVIRSLTISQRLLGTTEIVLIHHTGCGMLTFHDDDVKAQIEADTGIRPPFALEAFPELDSDIRQSVARIKASPFIPNKDSIRGFIYEVETGRLVEVKDLSPARYGPVRPRRSFDAGALVSSTCDGRSGNERRGRRGHRAVGAAAAPDRDDLRAVRQVRWRLAVRRRADQAAR
jgi:carbonic anhydrase